MVATRYVALLRGINVGGKNKVPMADLREVFAAAGHAEVSTYQPLVDRHPVTGRTQRPPRGDTFRWPLPHLMRVRHFTRRSGRPPVLSSGPAAGRSHPDTGGHVVKRAPLTPLAKGRQITGPERDKIATRLRDRYTQGAGIRDLMAETGRSYGWTHRLLRESGTPLQRTRRSPPHAEVNRPTTGPITVVRRRTEW